jgi:redox-sensitive bicupin YhaK (pirin superfamily)
LWPGKGKKETRRQGDEGTRRQGEEGIGGQGEEGKRRLEEEIVENEALVLYDDGDQVRIKAEGGFVRFLLVAGKPLKEPIAWGGPIVMNTKEELDLAFEEFRGGRFIK